MSRRAFVLPLLFFGLLALTAAVYWPGLGGGFQLDDYQNLHFLVKVFDHRMTIAQAMFTSNAGPLRRPIAMLSFALNMVFEGPDVWAFKYTNLMIHLLCGVLILTLSRPLLRVWRPDYSAERGTALALAVAALWLLAPLLVSTTLYTVQRMAQLSALFSLAGLISYVAGRERLPTKPRRAWLFLLLSVLVWMPLAGLSKENGFLLPLLAFVLELFFFRFQGTPCTRRSLFWFFGVFLALPAAATVAVLLLKPALLLGSYAGRPFTLPERAMTETRVLFYYLRNLLVPNGEGMGVFHDDYVLSTSWLHPLTTLFASLSWAALLVGTWRARRKAWWPLFFGIWFFVAAQALESTILPLELVFEYRNYLPAFGVFFGLVMALDYACECRPALRRPLLSFLVILPCFYAFATYQRASTWSSWTSVLLSAEHGHPKSPRVHAELASLYSATAQPDKALKELDAVAALRPDSISAVSLQRVLVYCQAGRPVPASVYAAMPEQPPSDDTDIYMVSVLRALVTLIYRTRCPAVQLAPLTQRIQVWIQQAPKGGYNGTVWDLEFENAQLLWLEGQVALAVQDLSRANRFDPGRPQALLLLMHYQYAAGLPRPAYQTLLRLRRQFAHGGVVARGIIAGEAAFIRTVTAAAHAQPVT